MGRWQAWRTMRAPKSTIAVLTALLYVACVAGYGEKPVLCIGDGGHVALERSRSHSSCWPCTDAMQNPRVVATPERGRHDASDCGSCVEIPVLVSKGKPHFATAPLQLRRTPFASAQVALPDLAVEEARLAGYATMFPPLPPPALSSHRTVVLLI